MQTVGLGPEMSSFKTETKCSKYSTRNFSSMLLLKLLSLLAPLQPALCDRPALPPPLQGLVCEVRSVVSGNGTQGLSSFSLLSDIPCHGLAVTFPGSMLA